MKKGITIVMVILCIGLAGIFVWNRVSSDREAPKIEIGNEKTVYKKGMKDAEMLKGVTAVDDKDGDVTDSLVVESVFESKDGKSVTVIYAAKDSNNNVGKEKRTLAVDAAENLKDKEKDSEGQEEGRQDDAVQADAEPEEDKPKEDKPEEEKPEEDKPEGEKAEEEKKNTENPEADPAAIPADQQAEIDAMQPEQPKFYLTEYQTTIAAGGTLDKLSYMKEIVDDSDSYDVLSRRVQVEDNVNTEIPGTYEVRYYVMDTQNNLSNVARLTVIVQ